MKRLVTLLLALIMVFAATGAFAADIKVLVNGDEIVFDRGPQIQDDKLMLPFRFIAEKLGAIVAWDNETKTVFAGMSGTVATMQIGNKSIFVNDTVISVDVAPTILVDRTMVSEEVLEGALGVTVSWDKDLNTATITK